MRGNEICYQYPKNKNLHFLDFHSGDLATAAKINTEVCHMQRAYVACLVAEWMAALVFAFIDISL